MKADIRGTSSVLAPERSCPFSKTTIIAQRSKKTTLYDLGDEREGRISLVVMGLLQYACRF